MIGVTAIPLLLLHTWGGDAATFGPVLPHLGRRASAPDLPGHGSRAGEPFRLAEAVAIAEHAAADAGTPRSAAARAQRLLPVDSMPVDSMPVDVVGSGSGAVVALALARRRPDRVRSLTLVGFPPTGGAAGSRRLASVAAALREGGTARFAYDYVNGTLRTADPIRRDLLRRAMAATRPDALTEALRATLGWADGVSPRPLGLPCHILRGEHDDRVAPDAVADLAGRLGATQAVVPGAGHVAYLDEPRAFAEALNAFHSGLRTRGRPADG